MGKLFPIKKLLKKNIIINYQRIEVYFLSYDKTHCFCQSNYGVYEFIETKDKKQPFIFIRLI